MNESSILITGANGQLGNALRKRYPKAQYADVKQLDITNKNSLKNYDWSKIQIIINGAAYTNVDGAETQKGRILAWQVNATAVANLAMIANLNNITLVHISTDYVFDGTKSPHNENEPFSPLNTYGSSKASGDLLAANTKKHYILRTSWVIGEGKNFVRTMAEIAKKGINPTVINDQIGRLTFTSELTNAIDYLLKNNTPFGTYNLTNSGKSTSWADITRAVYSYLKLPNLVTETSTNEYFHNKPNTARRPQNSELSLNKIKSFGYHPKDWEEQLKIYLAESINP